MGKHSTRAPQFRWTRTQFGRYVATVETVDYVVTRLRRHRWELTATTGDQAYILASTIGDSYRHLRIWAGLNHTHISSRTTAATHLEE